jgi:AcrR family transcriptional regulator
MTSQVRAPRAQAAAGRSATGAKPAGRGRPSKATGRDLKETILDAAESLFARHGFHGVTIRQVAAEAGVDTALIHY